MVAEGVGVHDWRGCDNDTPYLKPWWSPAGDLDAVRINVEGHAHPLWEVPEEQMPLVQNQADAEPPAAEVAAFAEAGMIELAERGREAATRTATQPSESSFPEVENAMNGLSNASLNAQESAPILEELEGGYEASA
jgi:hypothetical protein